MTAMDIDEETHHHAAQALFDVLNNNNPSMPYPEDTTMSSSQAPKWVAKQDKLYKCSYCDGKDEENSILIRCSSLRQGKACSKYVHLGCALHIGSCFLNDDGVFSCECQNHFERVLFCSCKKPYDDKLEMVQCDRCKEWYHEHCEGVQGRSLNYDEEYVCKGCRTLTAKGKTVSQSLIASNEAKDERYRFNSRGFAVSRELSHLTEIVCGVIDRIDSLAPPDSSGEDEISIEIVDQTREFLEQCMKIDEGEDESKMSALMHDTELLETWLRKLVDYRDAFFAWQQLALDAMNNLASAFSFSFSAEDKALVLSTYDAFERLEETNLHRFLPIAVETVGFGVLREVLVQIKLFFDLLHDPSNTLPSDEQLRALSSLRDATFSKALKFEKASRERKNDVFLSTFGPFFVQFCREQKNCLISWEEWYQQCCNLIEARFVLSHDQFVEFYAQGQTSPVSFKAELAAMDAILTKYNKFEESLNILLRRKKFDELFVKEVYEAKNELAIESENYVVLDHLTDYGVFSKACELFYSAESGRPTREAVEQGLLKEGHAVQSAIQSFAEKEPHPLLASVLEHTKSMVKQLTETLADVDSVSQDVDRDILTGAREDSEVFARLQALPIVTLQEQLISLHKTIAELTVRFDTILKRSASVELKDIVLLGDDLNAAVELCDATEKAAKASSLTDVAAVLVEKRRKLRTQLTRLSSLRDDAAKVWSQVALTLRRLRETEDAVSLEELAELRETAARLLVTDGEWARDAACVAEEGALADAAALAALDVLERQEEEHAEQEQEGEDKEKKLLAAMQDIVESIKHRAIRDATRCKVTTRLQVARTAALAREIAIECAERERETSAVSPSPSQQVPLPFALSLSEQTKDKMREVNKELHRLDGAASRAAPSLSLSPFDARLVSRCKRVFRPLFWKLQASLCLCSTEHVDAQAARALLSSAAALDSDRETEREREKETKRESGRARESLTDSREFLALSQAIEDFDAHSRDACVVFEEIERALDAHRDVSQASLPQRHGELLARLTQLQAMQGEFFELLSPLRARALALCVFFGTTRLQDTVSQQMMNFKAFMEKMDELCALLSAAEHAVEEFHATRFAAPCVTLSQLAEILKKVQEQTTIFVHFAFARVLFWFLEDLHGAALQWHHDVQALFPAKVSRKAKQHALQSRDELEALLRKPAALLVLTPSHERAQALLREAQEFDVALRAFLLPGERESEREKESEPHTLDALLEDVRLAQALKTQCEGLAVSIAGGAAAGESLQWLLALLQWMQSAPDPDLGAEQNFVALGEARHLALDGARLLRFEELSSPALRDALSTQYGVFVRFSTHTQGEREWTISPSARYSLRRANDFLSFLEREIALAESLEARLENALKSDAPRDALAALNAETKARVVLPDTRQLDRALQSKRAVAPNGSTAVTPSSSATASSTTSGVSVSTTSVVSDSKRKSSSSAIEKKEKFLAARRCATLGCERDAKPPSQYCSDRCACAFAKDALKALLKYKEMLRIGSVSIANATPVPAQGSIDAKKRVDLKAFDFCRETADYVQHVKAKNFLFSEVSVAQSQRVLSQLENASNNRANKRLNHFDKLCLRLPIVARRVVQDDALQSRDVLEEHRAKVRLTLEDFLVSVLQKMEYSNAMFVGLWLARELEHALFDKYYDEQEEKLNTDKFKPHQHLLMNNLRQAHNYHYVQKWVEGEMTVDQILSLTTQQFADPRTQQLRQEMQSALKEDSSRVSTEVEVEMQRRFAMSGTEAWRDKTEKVPTELTLETSAEAVAEQEAAELGSASVEEFDSLSPSGVGSGGEGVGEDVDALSSPGKAAESMPMDIEMEILNSANKKSASTPLKRSLDVHAPTIFSHESLQRPVKMAKLDSERETHTEREGEGDAPVSPAVESSPRNPPSFLELLKQQQQQQQSLSASHAELAKPEREREREKEKERERDKASRSSSGAPSPSPRGAATLSPPCLRLLCRDGSESLTITRSGGLLLRATALLGDRRLQGVVKASCGIDGRSKIADLDKSLREMLSSSRRIVATVALLVADASLSPESSYAKFCEEFTRDQRAAVCNMSESVQMYVIPPALKSAVSAIKHFAVANEARLGSRGVLWGVITSKGEVGPDKMTAEANNSVLPLDVMSFAPLPSSAGAAPAAVAAPLLAARPITTPVPVLPPFSPTNLAAGRAVPPALVPLVPGTVRDLEQMKQMAEMVARSGVAALQELKARPDARLRMPFLFEGDPFYAEFMAMLKGAVDRHRKAAMAFQQAAPNAFGGLGRRM